MTQVKFMFYYGLNMSATRHNTSIFRRYLFLGGINLFTSNTISINDKRMEKMIFEIF
jgi:hypothetical protein